MLDVTWCRVADRPERWERFGYGAVEARGGELWAALPLCGHGYMALTRADAQRQIEEREGMCFACCAEYRSSAHCFEHPH